MIKSRSSNEIAIETLLRPADGDGSSEMRFLGMSQESAWHIFGEEAYLARYGLAETLQGDEKKDYLKEFEDWTLEVPFPGAPTRVLCCPEDRVSPSQECQSSNQCCAKCTAPLCRECRNGMVDWRGKAAMPPAALANDMMVFYAPKELYTQKVTVMEMPPQNDVLTPHPGPPASQGAFVENPCPPKMVS